MGGKSSKSEFKRSKSLSSFGRSSQRSLFQKSRLEINQLNKKLTHGGIKLEEAKEQLDQIEQALSAISSNIKEKNKQQYESILKYLQETRQKVEEPTQAPTEEVLSDSEKKLETVELDKENNKVETISSDNVDDNPDNLAEVRQPLTSEEYLRPPSSPKIKFGIQVMPVNPRISQEMLKRNTLPINEAPKEEFKKIRLEQDTDSSNPNSPTFNKKCELQNLDKHEADATAIKAIEIITKDVNTLEEGLKYFKGKKWDNHYMEFHKELINNLIKLDEIQNQDDPVVKPEKRILTKRIEELIKILECLGEQDVEGQHHISADKSNTEKEMTTNLEGKSVTATTI